MDPITQEQARQDIIELGLPKIVLAAFDGMELPYDLNLHFREPRMIFDLGPYDL